MSGGREVIRWIQAVTGNNYVAVQKCVKYVAAVVSRHRLYNSPDALLIATLAADDARIHKARCSPGVFGPFRTLALLDAYRMAHGDFRP